MLYRGRKHYEWRTASISTKTWLDFLACGHYLFRELNSFPYVSLSEICLFRGTDNLHGQIYEHIFSSQIKVIFFLSFFKYYYVKTLYWVRIWPCSVAFFDSIAWTKNCSLLSLVIHKSNKLYHLSSTTRGISGDTFHLFREKTKSCDVLKAVAREQKIFDGWTGS